MGMLMSEISAATVSKWLKDYSAVISEHATELTDLDRQIGDADHGSNMARGMTAVAALDPQSFASAAELLKKAGMTLVSTVGGASGPLYGTFFLRLSTVITTDGEPTAQLLADALDAGLAGIVARGKAEVGDKTLVDALSPAVDAAKKVAADGGSAADALAKAAEAANEGRDATIEMVARRGRASYLGERSKGHQDPGATSMALLLESTARYLSGAE
ncbi:dihydroxyacetone kinase subunit DhaL [Cutibacterium sp. V947]|uniref:dihydroxyacetone kinase subunit DhaL n=1 Tax=unclassified Cutibacterium TaxID=2649671 RepID=UPI003EDEC7DD